MSINRAFLSGNLTRDPEARATASGTRVLTFGLAVNDPVRKADGGWDERANFIDCTVFGNRAEALGRILRKGMRVAVEGRLRWRQWLADDGTRRSKVGVVVDEVVLMSGRGDSARGGLRDASGADAVREALPGARVEEAPEDVYADEGIPF